jgi:predicted ribosomally synthesized peptide with SipW-like signal peptide
MKLKAIATAFFAIAAIMVATAAGAGNTTASFSDQVTSKADQFPAGKLQLNIGSLCTARSYGGVTGNVGVDGNTGCTVAGGATFAPAQSAMIPNTSSSATFGLKNIGTLSGTLSVGTPSFTVDAGHSATCTATSGNFMISSSFASSALAAAATANVPVTGNVPTTSANGCQGATFTASIPFLMNTASTTGFSDKLTSTGSTFVMGSLAAPVLSAAVNTDPTKVNLSWTNTDPAGTTFALNRYSGGICAGAATPVGTQVSPYTDSPGATGQYSYIVTAQYYNWSAVSNCASATTSNPVKDLFIHGDNTLGDNADMGSWTLPKGSKFKPVIWKSQTSNYFVGGGTNWVAGTWTLHLPPTQYNGSGVSATLWMSPTTVCAFSDSSSSSNLIGSVDFDESGATIPLTPNTSFVARTGTICLAIGSHDNGHNQTLSDNASYIEGPFS